MHPSSFHPACSLETFDANGFEQLCRNYAAEKVHWKFLQDEVCCDGVDGGGATAGISIPGQNAREAADQVAESRQLLAMFEGEGRESDSVRFTHTQTDTHTHRGGKHSWEKTPVAWSANPL